MLGSKILKRVIHRTLPQLFEANFHRKAKLSTSFERALKYVEPSQFAHHCPLPLSPLDCYFTNYVAANNPLEDRHLETTNFPLFGGGELFCVFDGHGGYRTADMLTISLPHYLLQAHQIALQSDFLQTLRQRKTNVDDLIIEYVSEVMKIAFQLADENIANISVERNHTLNNAGACGTACFLDSATRRLFVANAGDCRAVLGRRKKAENDQKCEYQTILLSEDHNVSNRKEVERVKEEHRGKRDSETLFCYGRLAGHLAPTRAFGDSYLKYEIPATSTPTHSPENSPKENDIPAESPKSVISESEQKHAEGAISRTEPKFAKCQTNVHIRAMDPPILSVVPDVKSITVQDGDFLILASDGLWDLLSSKKAVQLIASNISPCSAAPSPTSLSLSSKISRNPTSLLYHPSSLLIAKALSKVSKEEKTPVRSLLKDPDTRRFNFDDMTVTVAFFKSGGETNLSEWKNFFDH